MVESSGCRTHPDAVHALSGGYDIESAWTQDAATDTYRIVREPDPKSRVGHTRLIDYSQTAGFVLTVILDPHDDSGMTVWKTRRADLRVH